ncbi:MAG TPA: DUF1425 domain-containing protein [Planctomycetota bacterium]|nr:DUF1425 domain-containing protein [Planctomycetota bacterium]
MKTLASILAVAAVVAIIGCKGTYRARYEANPIQEQEKLILLDSKLKNIKVVRELPPTRVPGSGGQLEVGMVLVNTKDKDYRADVKVQFLDINGGVLEETTWEPVIFQRSMEVTIKKNSLNPAAADYRVTIRSQE